MSDKYPGFFTAIFGSRKKEETKEKPVRRRVRTERRPSNSDNRIYYPAKFKKEEKEEKAEPVENVEDA